MSDRRLRILVAEDGGVLRRAVTRALERASFDVMAVENGSEAAALLTSQTFDAVLTDVAMPRMTGLELLRTARERDLEVPFLVMSGVPEAGSEEDALRYGACEYVRKPFDVNELVRLVRRAIDLSDLARVKRESIRALGTGHAEAGDRAGLEVTLGRTLASMWIAYQPIVAASTGAVFGYEALMRSREPALPHPGAVLEAAERLGRLDEVGRTVRRKAPEPMHSAPPDAHLFINLHARDLNDETLASSGCSLRPIASRVVLEITERASLDGVADVRGAVARLREQGFRIAIDDLGAGYAGLTSFALLEPEFVKLDMSLIRDVHQSPIKQKLVRSMTRLCKDMGIAVVAEGIEVSEERDVVVDLGCDLMQGYLFAKPGGPFPEVCAASGKAP